MTWTQVAVLIVSINAVGFVIVSRLGSMIDSATSDMKVAIASLEQGIEDASLQITNEIGGLKPNPPDDYS